MQPAMWVYQQPQCRARMPGDQEVVACLNNPSKCNKAAYDFGTNLKGANALDRIPEAGAKVIGIYLT
eukprot:scaffold314352_cov19-Prasinocladus_malaysianus.AAC.1